MKIRHALFMFIVLTAISCHHKRQNSNRYTSVDLPKNDPTFLALKDTALAHLQIFIDSVNIHGRDTDNYAFQVKSSFADKGDHEHMWSSILNYDNGYFEGFLLIRDLS